MDITDAILGFVTGVASSLAPRFFRTKKEADDTLIKTVKLLQDEVQRMHTDLAKVRQEYDLRLKTMQEEYNVLLVKYKQLKDEFTNYKKQKA
jgi:phage host-nuclease inhibitor protein Gam